MTKKRSAQSFVGEVINGIKVIDCINKPDTRRNKYYLVCICHCSKQFETRADNISAGTVQCCGCLTGRIRGIPCKKVEWTEEQLINTVAKHNNLNAVIKELGFKSNGCIKRMQRKIEDLGIDTSHWYSSLYKSEDEKACNQCKKIKPMEEFQFSSSKENRRRPECKECGSTATPETKEWRNLSDEKKKEIKRERQNKQRRERSKTDPAYRLKCNIGTTIAHILAGRQSRKNGSFLTKIEYTMEELKAHLESQFEDWMNWDNYGTHIPNKKTWQLDHIKPHSEFYYTSMEDEAFKECWALSNLRPLEARQNLLDGVHRTRHKK